MYQHVPARYLRQCSSSRALPVIKSPLQFCVSQIQLNFQKSDYDINREVMELAKVNLDEKNLS